MKLQELFEDDRAQVKKEANELLKDMSEVIMHFMQESGDDLFYDLELQRKITTSHDGTSEIKVHDLDPSNLPAFLLSYRMNTVPDDNKLIPIADLSVVVDVELDDHTNSTLTRFKDLISKALKSKGVHVSWSRSMPWHFKTSVRTTGEAVLKKFDDHAVEKKQPSSAHSGPRYDPRAEFNNRPGEIARQRRVSGSAYSSSFGGDASNYRR